MAPPQIGDTIPDVTLYENTPGGAVPLKELCAGKKVIMFGVPGAFTPTCSASHLPSFLAQYDDLKAKGVAEIVCVSVNDPFVMAAWGKSYPTDGKIRMLADTNSELTKAFDIVLDTQGKLSGLRCERFAAVIDDGVIKYFKRAISDGGDSCTYAPDILSSL